MDLLQHARKLYAAGHMHDALEAAQAACDRAPRDSEAWWLLGQVSRHTGLVAASDAAFRKATELGHRFAVPYRISAERFAALIEEARSALSAADRRRLEGTTVRAQTMPTVEQVRDGVDPDALSFRERVPREVLVLFQVNHENHSASEEALRTLISHSLIRA
jgi:tetratricopeptide (TPR) repeat protein